MTLEELINKSNDLIRQDKDSLVAQVEENNYDGDIDSILSFIKNNQEKLEDAEDIFLKKCQQFKLLLEKRSKPVLKLTQAALVASLSKGEEVDDLDELFDEDTPAEAPVDNSADLDALLGDESPSAEVDVDALLNDAQSDDSEPADDLDALLDDADGDAPGDDGLEDLLADAGEGDNTSSAEEVSAEPGAEDDDLSGLDELLGDTEESAGDEVIDDNELDDLLGDIDGDLPSDEAAPSEEPSTEVDTEIAAEVDTTPEVSNDTEDTATAMEESPSPAETAPEESHDDLTETVAESPDEQTDILPEEPTKEAPAPEEPVAEDAKSLATDDASDAGEKQDPVVTEDTAPEVLDTPEASEDTPTEDDLLAEVACFSEDTLAEIDDADVQDALNTNTPTIEPSSKVRISDEEVCEETVLSSCYRLLVVRDDIDEILLESDDKSEIGTEYVRCLSKYNSNELCIVEVQYKELHVKRYESIEMPINLDVSF